MKKSLLLNLFFVLAFVTQTFAQGRTVTGTVTAADGSPLPGVTVLVKGNTSVGTATDLNGSYSLTVPAGANTLVFRGIGYQTVERPIGNAANINVSLTTDSQLLGEVVVTALGREQEERTLGYATQNLKSETLTQGRDRSLLNSMQGKVAGVNIQSQSGAPGSSTRVVIRGNKSFQGSNQALIVIDGIPIDNSSYGTGDNLNNGIDAGNRANDINPDDIESVNILKGPAAAALYGARAANGAIMITTKSGKNTNKKAEVSFLTSYTIEDVLRYPQLQNQYGEGFFGSPDLLENTSWGARFDGVVRPWGHVVNGQQRIKPYSALPDNVKEFYNYGSNFTNSISLSGGSEKTHYYTSYSNTQQKGITPGTEYARNTLTFRGSTELSNKFTSAISLSYTKSGGDFAMTGQGNGVFNQLIQTPRDIPIRELEDLTNPFNDEEGFYSPYTVNPYWAIANQTYENDVDRLFGNITVGYKFTDDLNLTYRMGTDVYSDRRKQFMAIRNVSVNNAAQNDNGMYSEYQIYNREFNSDLMLSYFRNISSDFTFDGLLGSNVRQVSGDRLFAQSDELTSNQFKSLSNNAGSPLASSSRDMLRVLGIYGTAKFGFKNYAWLEFTGRNDWASTLPLKANNFFYPAVSFAFDAASAFDLSTSTPVNIAKLRANYAKVGNGGESPYLTSSVFVKGNVADGFNGTDLTFPLNSIPGFEVSNVVGNNLLRPETTTSWEVGADLRFFDERLTVDASYYYQKSRDLIVTTPISYATGYGSAVLNAGDMSNKGIELVVGVTPIKTTSGFSWNVSANYTKNKNLVEKTYGGTPISLGGLSSASLMIVEGQPYGVFQAEDIMRDPQGRTVVDAAGHPRVASENPFVGNIQPDWMGGIVNTIGYKGARLSVVVDTRQGGKIYSRTRATQRFAGTAPETLFNDRQPFIIPNSVVQVGTTDEYIENTTAITNDDLYDYWGGLPEATNIIDASFTKLREISFSYKIPASWVERTKVFGNIEVGVSGRNLILWTPSENTYIDPETNNFGNGNLQGYDYSGNPSTRSWGGNLRLTF